MQPKRYVLNAEPGVVRVTPYGFLGYAKKFLHAAKHIPNEGGFSPVPYYLLCRSLELSLKAFILAKGETIECVKKHISHDLVKALDKANTLGLADITQISTDEKSEIAKANEYYARKGFEYFEVIPAANRYPDLPSLSVLETITDRLTASLKQTCLSCRQAP